MSEDQKARLMALLPLMKAAARRKVTQNQYNRAWQEIQLLESFLTVSEYGFIELGQHTAEAWIEIAEQATEDR